MVYYCVVFGGAAVSSLYTEREERRDRIQVYADIIMSARRPMKVTRILRMANVQYNQFTDCVERLCESGFMDRLSIGSSGGKDDGRTRYAYRATEMGVRWCELVAELYGKLEKS